MTEKYYPKEANLGQECSFWNLGNFAAECCYPKYELQGRTTCRGVIDDVCLYVKDGRQPQDETTQLLLSGTNTNPPNCTLLPPGQIY